MNEITTLPASVSKAMEHARYMETADRRQEAQIQQAQAVNAIAQANPALAGLVEAVGSGYSKLEIVSTDEEVNRTQQDHRVLGIKIESHITTNTVTKTVNSVLKFT